MGDATDGAPSGSHHDEATSGEFPAPAPAAVPEIQDVQEMLEMGRALEDSAPDEARIRYERAAERGSAHGMVLLAIMLEESAPDESHVWYERAAELGDTDAMVLLGHMCADENESIEWFRKAVEAGDDEAIIALAARLEDRDPTESRNLLKKAADAGVVEAMKMLGAASHDDEQLIWYERAARSGDAEAMVVWGFC